MMKKLSVALLIVALAAGAASAMCAKDLGRLRDRAFDGDPAAQFKLGYMFEHGIDMKQDNAEAFKWYSRAAENGNPCAQYYGAIMILNGVITDKDTCLAMKWLRRSAVCGNVNAQYLFGMRVFEGKGIAQNETAGLKWLRAAACGGHKEARAFLDKYYAEEDVKVVTKAKRTTRRAHKAAYKKAGVRKAVYTKAKARPVRVHKARVRKVTRRAPAPRNYCW